jgi:putative thioredoxin
MSLDVTDATFESTVIERSSTVPIVVDLWAPWCGPCKTLGPIIEQVIADTKGKVELVKVNIDENPGVAQAFGVQSIPLVVAIKDGQAIDGFLGAQPEHLVREFVSRLLPSETETTIAALIEAGDEDSLRQVLVLDPGHADAVVALANLLVDQAKNDEALALLARIPETDDVRKVAARARLAATAADVAAPTDDNDAKLGVLLDRVKDDEVARQEYLDILELMGGEDPRTAGYRKKLTSRLF